MDGKNPNDWGTHPDHTAAIEAGSHGFRPLGRIVESLIEAAVPALGQLVCNGRPANTITVAGRRIIKNPFALDGEALALFRACVENPDDYVRRGVFADCIEESRDPELGPWARWIRKQIHNVKSWTLGMSGEVHLDGRNLDFGWRAVSESENVTFRAGMIEDVTCSADQWQTVGDVMVNEWPIRVVTLTALPSQMLIRSYEDVGPLVLRKELRYDAIRKTFVPEDFHRRWPNVDFVGVTSVVLRAALDRQDWGHFRPPAGQPIASNDWNQNAGDIVADLVQLRERIRGYGVDLGAGRDRGASSFVVGREMMRHLYRGVDPVPQRQFRDEQYVLTYEEAVRALAARNTPRTPADYAAETEAARRNRTARKLYESKERRARVERRKAINERQARSVQ